MLAIVRLTLVKIYYAHEAPLDRNHSSAILVWPNSSINARVILELRLGKAAIAMKENKTWFL